MAGACLCSWLWLEPALLDNSVTDVDVPRLLSPCIDEVSTPSSPRRVEIHARTLKEVASVVMRQKSRKTQISMAPEVKRSSVVTDDRERFSQLFEPCISCLVDMEAESSPMEKVTT